MGDTYTNLATADARKLADKIKKKGGGKLVGSSTNLVDLIWGPNRPSRPSEPIKALNLNFAGKKFEEKIEDLRKELDKKKCAGLVVCKFSSQVQSTTFCLLISDQLCWMKLRGCTIFVVMSMLALIPSSED